MPRSDLVLNSSLLADRPICPHCDMPMWLVKIEHIGPTLCRRTFECAACDKFPAKGTKHRRTSQGMWKPIDTAPFHRDLELAVTDKDGLHALRFHVIALLAGGSKQKRRNGLRYRRRIGGNGNQYRIKKTASLSCSSSAVTPCPLWVNSGHCGKSTRCPLSLKADMRAAESNVCFGRRHYRRIN